MDLIYFEKQDGMLCAQHALNSLLQGQYFTVFDLAEIAKSLDEQESSISNTGGVSQNMDDSGFFSVQVMTTALTSWGVELVPLQSPRAAKEKDDPCDSSAFICNHREHWFTIRKIGLQWFNLNSMLKQPELISNTYLSLYLAQLQTEGYSIFVVHGDLPASPAHEVLLTTPVLATLATTSTTATGTSTATGLPDWNDDPELHAALEASRAAMEEDDPTLSTTLAQTKQQAEEEELRRAIEMSLTDVPGTSGMSSSMQSSGTGTGTGGSTDTASTTAAASTTAGATGQAATASTGATTVEAENVRANRSAFLDRLTAQS